jgi:hypothetical protein
MSDEPVDSAAVHFALTREAVAQYEEGKIDGKFAIGDALLVEVGIPGTRAQETGIKLKRCSEYLHDLGYSFEVKTLDAIRRVSNAYPKDERGDLLHSMRRPTWAALEVAARDPSILDDMIAVMDGEQPSLRLPDMVIWSLRKRKMIRVTDLREAFRHIDATEKAAYDTTMPNPPVEVIDLRGDDEVDDEDEVDSDPGEILLNIETPEMRASFKGDTSKLGAKARKSYSLADARALVEETQATLAASSGSSDEGFTYVVHAEGEPPSRPDATVEQMIEVIEKSKGLLYEFHRMWHEAGIQIDQAINVLEALDGIRVAWEQAHELIMGSTPEMH